MSQNHPAYHETCGRVHYNSCPLVGGGIPEVPSGFASWHEQVDQRGER